METTELISKAQAKGMTVLTEAEAKILLGRYGVPVVDEIVSPDVEGTISAAYEAGFPVVLKAMGAKFTHKTELGLVRLNLQDEAQVRRAAKEIEKSAGSELQGYLVQPMLKGRREFAAGLIRDAQFGALVMFGLGGVLTEVLHDVTFRIAPIDDKEAEGMLHEIRSADLLGAFRGEEPVDRKSLVRTLTGLSNLAMEHPEIAEVDINPLLVSPDGIVTAVDALISLSRERAPDHSLIDRASSSEDSNSFLDTMFAPRSIAVIGASRWRKRSWMNLMGIIARFGYKGRLYPINPEADEIDGHKAYPSLEALPEPADLVIIIVAAKSVPAALRDCIASGHKNVHVFSAGFKETGEQEGIRLQKEIEAIAAKGGLHVIGPNSMGIYNPRALITSWEQAPKQSGPVAFISQSGGNTGDFIDHAGRFGILFSKAVSYGNAMILDCTDFLPYFAGDDETTIVCLYLEGVKDGKKLLQQVKHINRTKPVIIMKGGLTKSGARTVASHTGSMSGEEHVWEAFFRQSGAVKVNSLEEMADALQAFLHLGVPKGRRVCVIGTGGGIGVSAADSFCRADLDVPALTEGTQAALSKFIPAPGNIIRNPIDAGIVFLNHHTLLDKTLRILSLDPLVDMVVVSLHIDWFFDVARGTLLVDLARHLARGKKLLTSEKPLAVSLRSYRSEAAFEKALKAVQQELLTAGVPVYEGLSQTAVALSHVTKYHQYLAALNLSSA
ncbi:MAG TPA: acetate--CoA ligase family protein [Syntrophobacteraceae bacterium]|nr:acetate--CoA ligase family protein [Syntrophobacteraceae bacterium]